MACRHRAVDVNQPGFCEDSEMARPIYSQCMVAEQMGLAPKTLLFSETDRSLGIKMSGSLCDAAACNVDVATSAHEHCWCETE